jgi:hypothetical protein
VDYRLTGSEGWALAPKSQRPSIEIVVLVEAGAVNRMRTPLEHLVEAVRELAHDQSPANVERYLAASRAFDASGGRESFRDGEPRSPSARRAA